MRSMFSGLRGDISATESGGIRLEVEPEGDYAGNRVVAVYLRVGTL